MTVDFICYRIFNEINYLNISKIILIKFLLIKAKCIQGSGKTLLYTIFYSLLFIQI
jgi:hypothetical protein